VNRKVIAAPTNLCIYDEYAVTETLSFLNVLDTSLIKKNELLRVDLSKTTNATAAASLLFFAIVNRAQLISEKSSIVQFTFPKRGVNDEGYRWIVKTGLSKALLSDTIEKVRDLQSSDKFFQTSDEPYEHFFSTLNMLGKEIDNSITKDFLAPAISEAMLNVSHHAYADKCQNNIVNAIGKRWWQCAWFDSERSEVIFIIYDLGIGIYQSYTGESSFNANTTIKQKTIIKEALTLGKSRFKQPERGKGSEDIKSPISKSMEKEQSLLVFSGRVVYSFETNSIEPNIQHIDQYVPGSLIQWSIAL